MARAAKQQTTAVAEYDEELARLAEASAAQEKNVGGGTWFKTKGGILQYDGNRMPDNSVFAVILGSVIENQYYVDKYDPDNPAPPDCYSFGTDEKEMAPHPQSHDRQHNDCSGCPHNQWGSAEKGRGKACRNVRRLALLPAGKTDKNGGNFELFGEKELSKSTIAFLKVPPTSIVPYAQYVKQLSSGMKKPPLAVVTRVHLEPDDKSQFKISFELVEELPKDYLKGVLDRRREAEAALVQPYAERQEEAPKGSRKGPTAKTNQRSKRY